MIEIKEAGTTAIIAAFDKAMAPRGIISKAQIRLVGNLAVSGRNILINNFTDRVRGELRYDSPDRPLYPPNRWNSKRGIWEPRHREPLGNAGKRGYFDVRGLGKGALTRVSLKGRGTEKRARLSSYPMNLWERPTKTGRRGLWIMTVRLAPMVKAGSDRHIAIIDKLIEDEFEKEMSKGG